MEYRRYTASVRCPVSFMATDRGIAVARGAAPTTPQVVYSAQSTGTS
jgi:hypothetical protein